jgi:hypothetical protein
MNAQHDQDFYTWAKQNAQLLRSGQAEQADWENIAEELEDMSGSRESELESRLGILLAHLLKWVYQRERRGNSWIATIKEQRQRVKRVIKKNPGLKSYLSEAFRYGYSDGRLIAMRETGLKEEIFPLDCPFTIEQTLDDDFWPE